MSDTLNISDLSEAARISPRAVRFYVQQKLLDPPRGGGRGSHYDRIHLDQLQRIAELQRAGHSLDAIRRILAGKPAPPPDAPPRPILSAALPATLHTRVILLAGVELSFDAARFNPPPSPKDLLALRELAQKIFRP